MKNRTPHDREIDLIGQAEEMVDLWESHGHHPRAGTRESQLLYGILCASVATARMLYNQAPDPQPDAQPAPDPEPTPKQLRDLWDWAHTHRLVVNAEGRSASDVHVAGIAPHCAGHHRVQLGPGVYVEADR